ncbi:GNAT family N-acetyltransferase [Proteiniborus sp. MB09-C3]|uniref:GNAT family N-acetyltransferase n=1 Tax=Proteiniborus sp. MB09-C3 TaxID=3050072 RepID=UPI002552E611|nr:GNAT family N-acetyltransferase [Proteiniborus sp. MB09-C3]WIV12747.1 GNAT family N-acetyltransferase [Proteiniborus sp. MB09-C3]
MEIYFNEVTPDNWRKINSLEVREDQKSFVASNVAILARAYAYRKDNSKVSVIYSNTNPIGLIMQRDFKEEDKHICILDQFMIDKNYQGKGYGKTSMKLWLSMIRREKRYNAIGLCYKENDYIAKKLYESLGFSRKPEEDDEDELIMRYEL